MKKSVLIVFLALILIPSLYAAVLGARLDTQIFNDQTPGEKDQPGSYNILSYQFTGESTLSRVILRMGGNVQEFNGADPADSGVWSWQPGRILVPLNPTSIDVMDFQGDGSMDDIVYISKTREITIREGDTESRSDILWTYSFEENIKSISSTDYDGDGRTDDLIVSAGQRIYYFKPVEDNSPIRSFQVSVDPMIIAAADLDGDGLKDDVVIGSWVENVGVDNSMELSSGTIRAYYSDGNQGWIYPSPALPRKVTYIKSFDRDADGKDDDVLAIFTDDTDTLSPSSDLHVVSAGSRVLFRSNIQGASPADFDEDGILDDFVVLSETQVSAYNSDTTPNAIQTLSKSEFNTTADKKNPRGFLGITSISLETKNGKSIFNDVAIFSSIADKQRAVFFSENFGSADLPSTPAPTTTPPTTTPPPPKVPTARISGVSDGTTVLEGSTVTLTSAGSSDPDGTIVSYEWLVDDVLRSTSEQLTLNTLGMLTGAHVITLKVTDNDGQVGVTSLTLSVSKANLPPIADAGNDLAVLEGGSVILSADKSSDPDGTISSYEWSYNGSVFSLEQAVNRTFALGIHTVTLKVTDNMGLSNTATIVITVVKENQPPKANAGEDITVLEGESVQFSAEKSSDQDGTIASYVWTMTDGKTVKQSKFNATFPVGVYTIILNVTDDKGAFGVDEITVTVEKRPSAFQKLWKDYSNEIKIMLLTLVGVLSSAVIFMRQKRKGLF